MISVCPLKRERPAEKRASQKLGLRKPSAPKKTAQAAQVRTPTETISSTSTVASASDS